MVSTETGEPYKGTHSIKELLDIRDVITTLADFDTDDVRVILDELCRS